MRPDDSHRTRYRRDALVRFPAEASEPQCDSSQGSEPGGSQDPSPLAAAAAAAAGGTGLVGLACPVCVWLTCQIDD